MTKLPVKQSSSIALVAASLTKKYPALNVLINNAGIMKSDALQGVVPCSRITQLIGGGSKLSDVVKFMDRGIASKRLRAIATAATISVTLTPAAWLEKPQTIHLRVIPVAKPDVKLVPDVTDLAAARQQACYFGERTPEGFPACRSATTGRGIIIFQRD